MSERILEDFDVAKPATTQQKIAIFLDSFKGMLLEKNKRYGDSALMPLGIFTKHSSMKGCASFDNLLIRLDDKLKRVQNADELRKNDLVDLMGYLTLLCIQLGFEGVEDLID
jgi:hypothetical protein